MHDVAEPLKDFFTGNNNKTRSSLASSGLGRVSLTRQAFWDVLNGITTKQQSKSSHQGTRNQPPGQLQVLEILSPKTK